MNRREYIPKSFCTFLLVFLFLGVSSASAENAITREYWLKFTDASSMIQALNIVLRNPSGKRIMGGQGKHLVVTDLIEQHDRIAELLSIMDLPPSQTKPQRIVMELVGRAGLYMHKNEIAATKARKNEAPQGVPVTHNFVSGVNSYDSFKSTRSVYAQEDAKLMQQFRHITDDPVLPSVGDLELKGVFKSSSGSPLALLAYGGTLFTARDGGLFEGNRTRVKGVASEILKEEVIVTGPDRVPHRIKFKSTL
jgi:hypothetical protein